MNIKFAINSQLSTTNSRKQTEQTAEQKQNRRQGDHLYGYQLRGGRRRMGRTGAGIKKYKYAGTEQAEEC